VAFCVGNKYQPGQPFKIIGAHTDSPNLKVKPRSKRTTISNKSTPTSIQIGVECYGGGLWHTWFDRDLGLSGRVFCREGSNIRQRLVKIDRAILRVPNLAIHLQTPEERKAFAVNKEDHLSPILAMSVQQALEQDGSEKETCKTDDTPNGWTEHQEPLLLQLLATELDIPIHDIVDFELNLFDIQTASLGGVHSEFLHSARLDNLASCFMAVQALKEMAQDTDYMKESSAVDMVVLYDHEEVGSDSA